MWGCLRQYSWCTPHPNWPLFQLFRLPECPRHDPPEYDAWNHCRTGSWTQPGLQDCSTAPRTGGNDCGVIPSQQMKHLILMGYFEMTHLSYSLAVILSLSHISWCQVITVPQDWGSHPQVEFCLKVILFSFEIRSEVLLLFTGEAMKSANCKGTKSQYNPPIHLHFYQKILDLKVLTKVQVLVNIIRNRIWSWWPHNRLVITGITMEPATWKNLFCNSKHKQNRKITMLIKWNFLGYRWKRNQPLR